LTKWSNVIFSLQVCPELSHVCGFVLGKPRRLVYIAPITSTAFYSLVPSDALPFLAHIMPSLPNLGCTNSANGIIVRTVWIRSESMGVSNPVV
jgi:hypothetical protein